MILIVIVVIVVAHSLSALVELRNNWLHDLIELLKLLLVVFQLRVRVIRDPGRCLLSSFADRVLIFLAQFSAELLVIVDLAEQAEGSSFELVPCLNGLAHALVFLLELGGGADHLVNLLLGW